MRGPPEGSGGLLSRQGAAPPPGPGPVREGTRSRCCAVWVGQPRHWCFASSFSLRDTLHSQGAASPRPHAWPVRAHGGSRRRLAPFFWQSHSGRSPCTRARSKPVASRQSREWTAHAAPVSCSCHQSAPSLHTVHVLIIWGSAPCYAGGPCAEHLRGPDTRAERTRSLRCVLH